ncbi:VOC domain-containing protein [Frankia sp. AiPs1]|uniref:VOC family protein n=1 Tax=Frankia sp. AiPa1 TaxID=573492 RepID=UPI00202BA0AE|nr:VOC family protein [Frankia sp. AiPa1]MCL9759934.1 VOC family protein [Frankia sp. AiPa1]
MKTESALLAQAGVPHSDNPSAAHDNRPQLFSTPAPTGAGFAAIGSCLAGLTFHHFDIAVAGLDEAREIYTVMLGIGAWRTRTLTGAVERHGRTVAQGGARVAVGSLGSGLVRLIEPGIGLTVAREALDRRGEGLFAIGYQVDDPIAALGAALVAGTTVEQVGPDLVTPTEIYLDGGSGLLLNLLHGGANGPS